MFSFLAVIVPLTLAAMQRRRMARPYEPYSLSLNGGRHSPDRSIRQNGSFATETTHLLTLKDAYACTHHNERENERSLRGRNIIIKSNSQDPFRLSDSVRLLSVEDALNRSATELAAEAAEAEALERSQNLAAAAAEAAESDDDDDEDSLEEKKN
jgi:hypothetical protein